MVRFYGHFRGTLEPFLKNFLGNRQIFLCWFRNSGRKKNGIIFFSSSKKILLEFLSTRKHFIPWVITIHTTFSSEYTSAPRECLKRQITNLCSLNVHPGPQLRPIDKGDKELIKFCRLWQASDKAEFCHCYVDTLRGVDKEVRAL